MTQLMDADDVNEVIVPAFSSPNPFISGHQCLLCRCDRPHLPKQNGDVTGKYIYTSMTSKIVTSKRCKLEISGKWHSH